MRIRKLDIEGYGRFVGQSLELDDGLHLIAGPNEKGKSTIRSFIADMLYGQKRAGTKRYYEPTHDLRKPWDDVDIYGGRLVYILDDNTEIEVCRNFDKKNETVQVFDRTNAHEITNDFDTLPNREPMFAEAHIGLSKAVFVNTATINHVTLEDLGSEDALAQIREKILSLADSGEEETSADAVLKRIADRIASIGQSNARSKPLPLARARYAELCDEHNQACKLEHTLGQLEEERKSAADKTNHERAEKERIEDDLRKLEILDRAERLREASLLKRRIDESTQRCFALSKAKDFPLNSVPEVLEAEKNVESAKAQLERTIDEQTELEDQWEQETEQLGEDAPSEIQEISEETENRLGELDADIKELHGEVDQLESTAAAARERLGLAQNELEEMPDFSSFSANPVEHLNELGNSFEVARRSCVEESEKLKSLQGQLERQKEQLAGPEKIFSYFDDFSAEAVEIEVQSRMMSSKIADLNTEAENLDTDEAELRDMVRLMRTGIIITSVAVPALLGFAIYFNNPGPFIPAAGAAVALVCCTAILFHTNTSVKRVQTDREEIAKQVEEVRTKTIEHNENIQKVLNEAECETIRELEAKYDHYRELRTQYGALSQACETQEIVAKREEANVETLFNRASEQLELIGHKAEKTQDVERAIANAVGTNQQYRDAKRRIIENRKTEEQCAAELADVKVDLEEKLEKERSLALEVRKIMRENGFFNERMHSSAYSALRSYRIRLSQNRQKFGRLEILRERLSELQERLKAETVQLEEAEDKLGQFVSGVGAETMEEWRALEKQAREYKEMWTQRGAVQEQFDSLLRDETFDALQKRVDEDEPVDLRPEGTVESLRRKLEALSEDVESAQQLAHDVQLEIVEQSAGSRSSNEIEEERGELQARIEDLELERDAAAYAATAIEEIAQDKHARVAPRLAKIAGGYLAEITGGVYDELLISRDMTISIRIPQTKRMNENPENLLSKGTVDQIYLALRLAMIECMSENGERVPMLLDDPFANYDDGRLANALRLLSRISEQNQVILMTCREDVLHAAKEVGASILELKSLDEDTSS